MSYFIVHDDIKAAMPLTRGTVVKWEEWREWKDPATEVEYLAYSIRYLDEPIPEQFWDQGVSMDRSFHTIESVPTESASFGEGQVRVIPYITRGIFSYKRNAAALRVEVEAGRVPRQMEGSRAWFLEPVPA